MAGLGLGHLDSASPHISSSNIPACLSAWQLGGFLRKSKKTHKASWDLDLELGHHPLCLILTAKAGHQTSPDPWEKKQVWSPMEGLQRHLAGGYEFLPLLQSSCSVLNPILPEPSSSCECPREVQWNRFLPSVDSHWQGELGVGRLSPSNSP